MMSTTYDLTYFKVKQSLMKDENLSAFPAGFRGVALRVMRGFASRAWR